MSVNLIDLTRIERQWRAPVFAPRDLVAVSGISESSLKQYIHRGILFTETKYTTTKGKARKYSLGDLCQARAMHLLISTYAMGIELARVIAWGITDAMREIAAAEILDQDLDMSLLVVRWPIGDDRSYGAHGITGEELSALMTDTIYRPALGAFCVTRGHLLEHVVGPCIKRYEDYEEARRDDVPAK